MHKYKILNWMYNQHSAVYRDSGAYQALLLNLPKAQKLVIFPCVRAVKLKG
jgi:hypothetical protein